MATQDQLIGVYERVKPSIAAIVASVSANADLPEIVGTGFVVNEFGLIMTNAHVANALGNLPRVKSNPEPWPAKVMLFRNIPDLGMVSVPMDIQGVFQIKLDERPTYGPEALDLAVIRVAYSNLPTLTLRSAVEYHEGHEIAIAGYPMGTDLLRAPGYAHQINPTLRRGIVSAVLPFPCANPHALLLDVMTQGGSSGSPVFDPTSGDVVGVLYAGISDFEQLTVNGVRIPYKVPAGISLAVPSHWGDQVLKKILKSSWRTEDVGDVRDFEKFVNEGIEEMKAGKLNNVPAMLPDSEIVFTDPQSGLWTRS